MTVEFGDAVAALASSLVNARRTLDTATSRLAQVYAADETLKSLPTPAFTLAEAEFEVPYVVEQIETEPEVPAPELPRRTVVRVGTREVASLGRGVTDRTREGLDILLEQYARTTELYARARQDPAVLSSEAVPTRTRPDAEEIALLRTGASKTARDQLDKVLGDLDDVRGALLAAADTVGASRQPRVMVRLDATALAEAAPDRIQRARFTFRDMQRTTVDVDGHPIDVPD